MKIITALTLVALLAGCGTVSTVKGPDGRPAQVLHCETQSWCYNKASELCPNGYTIVSSSAPIYSLVVQCKGPETARN
jgi:hypothetical protein